MIRMLSSMVLGTALSAQAVIAAPSTMPRGATVGKSGFATVRIVPPSPTRDVVSQRATYKSQDEWYAQEAGVSVAEARKRNAEQRVLQPTVERLRVRLASAEPDNYVDVQMVHRPDWGYIFYFKRDPAGTLARYSVNPRFRAAQAGYKRAELDVIVAPWVKRFVAAGILNMTMTGPLNSRVDVSLGVTEAEYRAIAAAKGWGAVPAAVVLGFARPPAAPAVDPRVARLLRGFASEKMATGMQMEMGMSGRVVLDDGCLRLASKGGTKGPLAVFHQETGIGLDAQGYLSAIDRRTGKAKGRIGEYWSWSGPNPGTMFDGLDALKAACGGGPVTNVGNPESDARFKARYAR